MLSSLQNYQRNIFLVKSDRWLELSTMTLACITTIGLFMKTTFAFPISLVKPQENLRLCSSYGLYL
jgi:hypothetical protein